MTLLATRVTVADTATLIRQADADGVSLIVRNPAEGKTVDLGDSEVTSGEGFELVAGEERAIDLAPGESLYGICEALAEQAVQVLVNRVG